MNSENDSFFNELINIGRSGLHSESQSNTNDCSMCAISDNSETSKQYL